MSFQWNGEDAVGDVGPVRVSRSQRKRESTALQQLGERLTRCPEQSLSGLPISVELCEAVRAWHRMTTREARRRQLQYIGRLMREEADPEAIMVALELLCRR